MTFNHNKNKLKVLLAGTPNFSVLTFSKIIDNFDVVGLIAQPNRPIGRNLIVTEPPTVMMAKNAKKVKIFQPEKVANIYDELRKLDFDVLLTMAYGQIIPENILKLAKKGSYNIHGSLLPKYRGASPIQYALLNGDKETGITFMEMNSKMDAGDIVFQETLKIEKDDTFDSLLKKMSSLSASNIVSWLNNIQNNSFNKTKQNESEVTYAPKISKEDEKILFDTMDNTINKIRSLSSSPGAYLILNSNQEGFKFIQNQRMKVFRATKKFVKNAPEIKCKDGVIYALEYQFEGRRKVIVN